MTDDARDQQFRSLYRNLRIETQRQYYRDRAEEYRQAHGQTVRIRNGLLFAAASAGAISQFFTGSARSAWAVAAAVLAALAGAVTAYESLIGFPQLEKLYSDAEQNLEHAAIDWDDPTIDTAKEIDRVELIFRSERGQWGQLVVKSGGAGQTDNRPSSDDHGTDEQRPSKE